MTTPHEVETRFTVDLSALRRGVEGAKAEVGEYRRKVEEQSAKASKGMAEFRESIDATRAAFAALGAAAVIQTARAVTELARLSDQAQRIDRYFTSSFGIYTDTMRDWASGLSDAYGLAESQVESFAARLNSAFIGAGQSARDAAEMSQTLTQLSYDLSVKLPYATLEELQEMINDLAVGGGESALEKILPGLDEEALKAKARELGILGDELTVVAKQTAAYHLLMEQYSDDIGLYSETGDTATRALDDLDAAVHDLSESLGTLLAPTVQLVADVLSDLVDVIDSMTSGIGDFFGINKLAEVADYDLGVITQAMGQFREEVEETDRTLMGLAGFDKLNLLNTSPTTGVTGDTNETDWEHVFLNFSQMYENGSEEATDAMEEMWEHLLDQSDKSGEEMKEILQEYFDWIESEVPQVSADAFYEGIEDLIRAQASADSLAAFVNQFVEEAVAQGWMAGLESYQPPEKESGTMDAADLVWNAIPFAPNPDLIIAGVENIGKASEEVGKVGKKIEEELGKFGDAVGRELNAFADWAGGIFGFADGGVFLPNHPVLGILGDNTREVEVAAPKSVIVDAVKEADRGMGPISVDVHMDAPEADPFDITPMVDALREMVGSITVTAEPTEVPRAPETRVESIVHETVTPTRTEVWRTEAQTLPDGIMEALRALADAPVREIVHEDMGYDPPREEVPTGTGASAIADAVARAVSDAMRGHGSATEQTINLTLQLDGRTLSREVYRLMQRESSRRF